MRIHVPLFLFILLASSLQSGAIARNVSDSAIGYSLDLPDDWRPIPAADLDAFTKLALAPSSVVHYVAGFEPASHDRSFQYPYILIQVLPYSGGQSITGISEADLQQIVAKFSGMKTDEIKKGLSSSASNFVADLSDKSAAYSTSPPGFTMTITVATPSGKIFGHSTGLVGKDHSVMVHFYAQEADYAALQSTAEQIAGSFHLDPGQQVALRSGWSGAIRGGAVGLENGAMVGLLFGIVAVIFRKKFRKSA